MKFLDTNTIVNAFYLNPNKQKCEEILKSKNLIINTLILIEVFHILNNILNKEKAELCIKLILKSDIQIIPIDINLIFESLKRTHKYNLNFFDLIHYTTALLNNCSEIISYDQDFNNLEIKRTEP